MMVKGAEWIRLFSWWKDRIVLAIPFVALPPSTSSPPPPDRRVICFSIWSLKSMSMSVEVGIGPSAFPVDDILFR
jgi:hypothetical protein